MSTSKRLYGNAKEALSPCQRGSFGNLFVRLCLLFIVSLSFSTVTTAQTYKEDVDTIWGAYNVKLVKGKSVNFPSTTRGELYSWPTYTQNGKDRTVTLAYYVHLPTGKVNGTAYLTAKSGVNTHVKFRLINPVNNDTLIAEDHTLTPGEENKVNVVKDYDVATDGWYRLEYSPYNGDVPKSEGLVSGTTLISKFRYTLFQRESDDAIVLPWIYSSLSTYMNQFSTTDSDAPTGASYDWCYMEIFVPKEYERGNTYWSCMNLLGGYLGIQTGQRNDPFTDGSFVNRTSIFSMWDNGDTSITPDLPDYMRSGAMDYDDPSITITHYDNEGSGTHTHLDHTWESGKWVQILFNCRPENTTVTLQDANGADYDIKYGNTVVSFWWKQEDEDAWHYLSTLRKAGESEYVDSWLAFIENWNTHEGTEKRRAFYRNAYKHSIASGKWYYCNKAYVSKYDDTSRYRKDKRDRREDIGYGLGETLDPAMKNTFYMETGGFDQRNDWKNKWLQLPMVDDNTAVDTINIDALFARVKRAMLNNKAVEIKQDLGSTNDSVMATAKLIIDNANQFNFYPAEDIAEIQQLYNSCLSNTSQISALRTAIETLCTTVMPLKYGSAANLNSIGTRRAYQLYNGHGYGIVCGGSNGSSMTVQEKVDVTDPLNNWIIVRNEANRTYQLYNIGLKKYLDLSKSNHLSDNPKEVTISTNGTYFSFKQGSLYLSITQDKSSIEATTSTSQRSWFALYDNIASEPTQELADELLSKDASVDEKTETKGLFVPSVNYSPDSEWTAEVMLFSATNKYGSKTNNSKKGKVLATPPNDANGNAWYSPDYTATSFNTATPTYYLDDTSDPIKVNNNGDWEQKTAPFGTNWAGAASDSLPGDIYIRRKFTTTEELNSVILSCGYNEGPFELYINGTKIRSATANSNKNAYLLLTDEQVALIKTDGSDNVIAMHVHNNYGESYADCGLYGSPSTAPMIQAHSGFWDCYYQTVSIKNGTISDDWYKTSYTEDDTWTAGKGPFENYNYNTYIANSTKWEDSYDTYLYVRRHFTLTQEQVDNIGKIWLWITYDQAPVVYVNDVKVMNVSGWMNNHKYTSKMLDTIKLNVGDNVIACRVGEAGSYGDQFLDIGLYYTLNKELATGISLPDDSVQDTGRKSVYNDKWYDLTGRQLAKKPTKAGIYIYNGRKIVIK